jgi:hypothetical protein
VRGCGVGVGVEVAVAVRLGVNVGLIVGVLVAILMGVGEASTRLTCVGSGGSAVQAGNPMALNNPMAMKTFNWRISFPCFVRSRAGA